jgi:hypothetical protein
MSIGDLSAMLEDWGGSWAIPGHKPIRSASRTALWAAGSTSCMGNRRTMPGRPVYPCWQEGGHVISS